MSQVKGTQFVIVVEPDGICELCGVKDELRPYGPNGENICFDCGMKNSESTQAAINAILDRCTSVRSISGLVIPV